MRPLFVPLALSLVSLAFGSEVRAQGEVQVSIDEALRSAKRVAPDLVIARKQEAVAHAEVGIAGLYPNPSVAVGSSRWAAALSGTVSIPLIILGQRGAAIDAARADEATVALDTQVSWNDVRQATERAFVNLWLAEGVAAARRDSAVIESALEATVIQRVEVGSSPQIDALRLHAEKLRADADVLEANAAVTAAGSELGRWIGVIDGGALRTRGGLFGPDAAPPLGELLARIDSSAPVRREQSDVRASQARADRERALVRPAMSLDLGFDAFDPTISPPAPPNAVNYRGQLVIDVPIFNQRGGYIEREQAMGDVARARVQAAHARLAAELAAAYRTFDAATARQRTMIDAVVPAAQGAAKATEEAYTLGRAQLIAVLDAERTLVDVRLTAYEAQAARANAWADVEHALGVP